MALADAAPRALTDDRKSLYEQVVQVLAARKPLTEFHRLVRKLLVAERPHLVLELVDERHHGREVSHLAAFARTKDFRKDTHC